MDWKELGKKIADTGAQILGEVIPYPGAGLAADALSEALGVEKDPDKIAAAMDQDPQVAAKLQRIENEHEQRLKEIAATKEQVRMEEVTKRQQAVSETIQAGYRQGVLWRRAVGWSFALGVPFFGVAACGLIVYGAYVGKLVEITNAIKGLVSAGQPIIYAYLAILGVAGYQEGKMGRKMAGESEGGIAQAIKAIRGK